MPARERPTGLRIPRPSQIGELPSEGGRHGFRSRDSKTSINSSTAAANGFIMKDATAEDIVKRFAGRERTDLRPRPPRRNSSNPDVSATGTMERRHDGARSVRLTKREQEIKDLIAAGWHRRSRSGLKHRDEHREEPRAQHARQTPLALTRRPTAPSGETAAVAARAALLSLSR